MKPSENSSTSFKILVSLLPVIFSIFVLGFEVRKATATTGATGATGATGVTGVTGVTGTGGGTAAETEIEIAGGPGGGDWPLAMALLDPLGSFWLGKCGKLIRQTRI